MMWRGLGLLLVLLAGFQAHARQGRLELAAAGPRGQVVDALERMQARWKNLPEPPGAPALPGFPERSGWTEDGAASRYFPPPNAEKGRLLARNWKGNEFPVPVGAMVISWYAGIIPSTPEELLLLATVTSPMLGAPVEGAVTPREAIRGQEALRAAMARACGTCAPEPGILSTYRKTPFPPSIAVTAEVGARGTGPVTDPAPPLGALAAAIRRGEEVSPEALEEPGQAGLVALEWGRQGDRHRIPLLLKLAADGPSGPDRLAALFAVQRLTRGEGLGPWEGLPGTEEGIRRARLLLATPAFSP